MHMWIVTTIKLYKYKVMDNRFNFLRPYTIMLALFNEHEWCFYKRLSSRFKIMVHLSNGGTIYFISSYRLLNVDADQWTGDANAHENNQEAECNLSTASSVHLYCCVQSIASPENRSLCQCLCPTL